MIAANTKIVGIQFSITLFIPNSLAMSGTPIITPFITKTPTIDEINDIKTIYFSSLLCIIISYKF